MCESQPPRTLAQHRVLSSVLFCWSNRDMPYFISCTSLVIRRTTYLFMLATMFTSFSLFKFFTQIKPFYALRGKWPFFCHICWKYLFPVCGLSFDLVPGILNHTEVLLESSLLQSPTKPSLVFSTLTFFQKKWSQREKLTSHQNAFPWFCKQFQGWMTQRIPRESGNPLCCQ